MKLGTFLSHVYIIGIILINKALAKCYFPGELQGVWATQAAPDVLDAPIGYTMVTIDANEISSWGQCYSKIDGNIILADRSGPHSAPCFRCFRLVVASVNVAALVSGNLKTCSSSVEDALTTCPTTERGSTHIILYKVRTSWGESGLQETQCPFSGIYFFSYEKGERSSRERNRMQCEQPTSEMSNCPFGFSLSLQYRDCTFEDPRVASWHCLGSWKGLDGQQYTAVLDTYVKEGDGKPKYKCGIFREDTKSGRIFLAFSQDSTCTNGLTNAENGHERYTLNSASSSPLPTSIREKSCRFPTSLRGQWHNTIIDRSTITYKDEHSFDTLHMQCVREFGDSERYAVYTRTDCGKWFFTCITIKRRSANIIEIMFGENSKDSLHPDICNLKQFGNQSSWITQARTILEAPTSCPIVGTYRGELPDSPGYCAQLFSDCTRTDLMYYAVDECSNPNSIYERSRFPQPHEVTPGVFIPPERFDVTRKPLVTPRSRGKFPPDVPREIQVGTINILPPKTRTNLKNLEYDVTSVQGATLIISKKKKREAFLSDHISRRNPKTTTISFAWGRSNSMTTTTSHPLFDMNKGQFDSNVPRNPQSSFPLPHSGNQNYETNVRPFDTFGANNEWHQGNFRPSDRSNFDPRYDALSRDRDPFDLPPNRQDNQFVPQQSQQNNNRNSGFDYPHRTGIDEDRIRSPLPSSQQSQQNFNRDTEFEYPQRGGAENRLRPPPNTDQSGFPHRDEQIHHNQNFHDTREDRVRGLPSDGKFNRDDSLGFWPKNEDVNNRHDPNFRPQSVIRNEQRDPPIFLERTVPPDHSGWRNPPSPSPLMRDISSSSTPSPFRSNDKNDNQNKNKMNRKRNPVTEEREYQCIGQWEENGRVYALTQRKDIHTFECFVGITTAHGVVYMKEVGSSCRRDIKPDDFGMRTVIKEECIQESARSKIQDTVERSDGWRGSRWITSRSKGTTPTRPPWVPTTTRPWKPITGRPRRSSSNLINPRNYLLSLGLLILYCINSFL